MKKYNFTKAIFLLIGLAFVACTEKSEQTEEVAGNEDTYTQISQAQFESDKMQIGELISMKFQDEVSCNGYLIAPPNSIAQVSSKISGTVESINFVCGRHVSKGQTLCVFSSNELIVLQQNFAESAAYLQRLKADYERSKSLLDNKIGSKKDFIAIESEFKAMKAKYQSLKLQLEQLNLNPAKIQEGEFYPNAPITAPISGYITDYNVVRGQFIEQQAKLFEIVDVQNLEVELAVFEKDVNKLQVGQTVRFNSLDNPTTPHIAKIEAIGKSINPETKTVVCIAGIEKSAEVKGDFINRAYIEAKIAVQESDAQALPSSAILKADKEYYVFVVAKQTSGNYDLRKVKVEIGRTADGFTEILGNPKLSQIVTHGVYNLPID